MSRILIVTQSHLSRNPRVLKEALALYKAGFSITILTGIYSNELLKEDKQLLENTTIKYIFYSNLSDGSLRTFVDRTIKTIAVKVNKLLGIESVLSLGYGFSRLLKQCLTLNADLYIMHQELPTVVGLKLLKKKYNVAFDIEDWYSEDLLSEMRQQRPIALLKQVEKNILKNANICYTTSIAMANGLAECYKSDRKPAVIYNTFKGLNNILTSEKNRKFSLYWFSQTIGPGRGLEFFIDGMGKSDYNWNLTLRGNIDKVYKSFLLDSIAQKDQLIFKPMISNSGILADMKNYEIGLALEPGDPPNKNLTLSNKFFHYLAAGMPVIASNTEGHKEIGDKHPEFIFLYRNNDIGTLIELLNTLGEQIANHTIVSKQNVLEAFKKNYSWEKESVKLVNLISSAIKY